MPDQWLRVITDVYKSDRRKMVTYARQITQSFEAAEDAVHMAYLKLVKVNRFVEHPRTYIFRAIRHAAIDIVNQKFNGVALTGEFGETVDTKGGASREQVETNEMLVHAISQLSLDQREVISLRLQTEMTFSEIAEVLMVPQGTVATHYRRGLEMLREIMEVKS